MAQVDMTFNNLKQKTFPQSLIYRTPLVSAGKNNSVHRYHSLITLELSRSSQMPPVDLERSQFFILPNFLSYVDQSREELWHVNTIVVGLYERHLSDNYT